MYLIVFFATLFLPLRAQAEPACAVNSHASLVACLEANALERQALEKNWQAEQNLTGIAKQWPNPELGVESVHHDADNSETTASLLFPLPIGRRSAEISGAEASVAKATDQKTLTLANHHLETALRLYRLSHLRSEIAIAEESIATYEKIVEQFQRKPALSPEHQVSLSVFRMAASDSELRLVSLQSEEDSLYRTIEASSGISRETVEKNLPARRTSWPAPPPNGPAAASLPVKIALSERNYALSLLNGANAAAWSEIKVGPALKFTKQSGAQEKFFGVALSLPLPLFNWNGPAKAFAQDKLAETEISLALAERNAVSQRAALVNKYEKLKAALQKSLGPKTIQRNHEEIERLFFRGLVPSSLVIEAHRQLFELEQRRNESEREALESLGQIQIMDGGSFAGVL